MITKLKTNLVEVGVKAKIGKISRHASKTTFATCSSVQLLSLFVH